MIRRIFNISLLVIAVLGLFVSLGFSSRESDKVPCRDISIQVDHSTDNFFVTEDDVMDMILSKGDSLKGSPITSIPIGVYERHISANPSVKRAEVYTKH
ncbi:MAG: hypothetical protein ACPG5W_13415, partial [Flavobacteriales bacterium]